MPRVEFAQATDPGRDPTKQVNEDACGYAETRFGYLGVLCDGMGGHYGGKDASQLGVTVIFDTIGRIPDGVAPALALKQAIEEAGARVYELGGPPETRTRPGSTVVAILLHQHGLDVAHVGDSRAYVVRANQIYPLTRDHSMVQTMIDAGLITEEQAMGHPDANKITRALGMRPDVEVDVRPEPMELFPGDIIMTASDGLTDLALSHELLNVLLTALQTGGLSYAAHALVQFANERGGHDNITVQLARILEVHNRPTAVPHLTPTPAMTDVEAQSFLISGVPTSSSRATAHALVTAPDVGATPMGTHAQGQPTSNGRVWEAPPPSSAAMTVPDDPTDALTRRLPRHGEYPPSSGLTRGRDDLPPSRNGLLFVVLGGAIVIAVLVVAALWAFLGRG